MSMKKYLVFVSIVIVIMLAFAYYKTQYEKIRIHLTTSISNQPLLSSITYNWVWILIFGGNFGDEKLSPIDKWILSIEQKTEPIKLINKMGLQNYNSFDLWWYQKLVIDDKNYSDTGKFRVVVMHRDNVYKPHLHYDCDWTVEGPMTVDYGGMRVLFDNN